MAFLEKRGARMIGALVAATLGLGALAGPAMAQDPRVVDAERYRPGIWIDPDGCEHWVMDDGVEGYMSPHVRRDGTPVCHSVSRCAVVPTDTMFATNSATIAPGGAASLRSFFSSNHF